MGFDRQPLALPPLDGTTWGTVRQHYPRLRCRECERVWGLLVPDPDDDRHLRFFQPMKSFRSADGKMGSVQSTTSWASACRWVGDDAGRQAIKCVCRRDPVLLDRFPAERVTGPAVYL